MAQRTTGYCPVSGLYDLFIITPQINRGKVDLKYQVKGYGQKSGTKCVCCGFDLMRYPVHNDGKCYRCMFTESELIEMEQERAQQMAIYLIRLASIREVARSAGVGTELIKEAVDGEATRHTARALFRVYRNWGIEVDEAQKQDS